ncbi:MAG: hypothetical protein K0U54_10905 [Bacteroidetes bacterium]|nr:hypothetical protein [Bacteroidota bacterium]
MKNTMHLFLLLLSISATIHAQDLETNTSNVTTNTDNFMDLQANVYGDIFGNTMNIDAFKGIEDFKGLVNKMEASPEVKKQLITHYELYSNSLDPKKKELAKVQFNELLIKTMQEGQTKDKQTP